jgi:hypothetical protein
MAKGAKIASHLVEWKEPVSSRLFEFVRINQRLAWTTNSQDANFGANDREESSIRPAASRAK